MGKYDAINIISYEDDVEDEEGALLTSRLQDAAANAKSDLPDDPRNTHPQDHLTPPFSSPDRPSNLLVGSFNLIATIVGGGVLSLPIVFCKMGVFFTILAMILSAYMTHMSLVMLCYCSRRAGGSSYGEVARSAFGEKMEEGVSWLLFIYLLFAIMGFMVLLRDIWTPLVGLLLGKHCDGDSVLVGVLLLLLPFFFLRSLHALRYNCYVGFASVSILCIALVRGGWEKFEEGVLRDDDSVGKDFDIDWFKIPAVEDVLFSFPIASFSFLCQFNIIAVHNSLSVPTRERTGKLIQYAIIPSFILMTMFGIGGYVYAGVQVQGNILLNVPMNRSSGEGEGLYYIFLLGRIGCGAALALAMPLMVLPCRESLLEVIDVFFHRSHHREDVHVHDTNVNHRSSEKSIEDEPFCWKWFHKLNKNETLQDSILVTEDELLEIVHHDHHPHSTADGTGTDTGDDNQLFGSSTIIRKKPIQKDWIFRNSFVHYSATIFIISLCFFGAVKVRGIAVVWNFVGSSLAFFVSFILPCSCFIAIEREVPRKEEGGDRHVGWIRVAWVMLAFSVVGSVICTWNSVLQMKRDGV
ncbi:hypothetical protein ACHAXS_007814 [Conticribra weissflogii]